MSLAQGNNTPTRPRIEPGSPDPESDALTIRPVRPPDFIFALSPQYRGNAGDLIPRQTWQCNVKHQRTNGPVKVHLISWPSKAQNIQNLENIW